MPQLDPQDARLLAQEFAKATVEQQERAAMTRAYYMTAPGAMPAFGEMSFLQTIGLQATPSWVPYRPWGTEFFRNLPRYAATGALQIGGMLADWYSFSAIAALAGGAWGMLLGIPAGVAMSWATGKIAAGMYSYWSTRDLLETSMFRWNAPGLRKGGERLRATDLAEIVVNETLRYREFDVSQAPMLLQLANRTRSFLGVESTEQFRQRFRQVADTVRRIMSVFRITMEEAAPIVEQMTAVGFRMREIPTMATLAGAARYFGYTPTEALQQYIQLGAAARTLGFTPKFGAVLWQETLARTAPILAKDEALREITGPQAPTQLTTQLMQIVAQHPVFKALLITGWRGGRKFDVNAFRQAMMKAQSIEDLQLGNLPDTLSHFDMYLSFFIRQLTAHDVFMMFDTVARLTGHRPEDLAYRLGMNKNLVHLFAAVRKQGDAAFFNAIWQQTMEEAVRRWQDKNSLFRPLTELLDAARGSLETIGVGIGHIASEVGDWISRIPGALAGTNVTKITINREISASMWERPQTLVLGEHAASEAIGTFRVTEGRINTGRILSGILSKLHKDPSRLTRAVYRHKDYVSQWEWYPYRYPNPYILQILRRNFADAWEAAEWLANTTSMTEREAALKQLKGLTPSQREHLRLTTGMSVEEIETLFMVADRIDSEKPLKADTKTLSRREKNDLLYAQNKVQEAMKEYERQCHVEMESTIRKNLTDTMHRLIVNAKFNQLSPGQAIERARKEFTRVVFGITSYKELTFEQKQIINRLALAALRARTLPGADRLRFISAIDKTRAQDISRVEEAALMKGLTALELTAYRYGVREPSRYLEALKAGTGITGEELILMRMALVYYDKDTRQRFLTFLGEQAKNGKDITRETVEEAGFKVYDKWYEDSRDWATKITSSEYVIAKDLKETHQLLIETLLKINSTLQGLQPVLEKLGKR